MNSNSKPIKLLIAAGGTGGHVMPALAVAEWLIENGHSVEWIGTPLGIEHNIVPKKHIPLHYITIRGLRGKGPLRKIITLFQVFQAIVQSLLIILKVKPNVVLTMGGFVSGPAGIAAWLLRRPLVVHEQNAIGGWTNQILSRFACQVLLGYPQALPKVKHKSLLTGNPLRKEFTQIEFKGTKYNQPKEGGTNQKEKIRLFVLGGSQGALKLNQLVPQALSALEHSDAFEVLHQTGNKESTHTQALYDSANISVTLTPFIEDMVAAYEWADIIICRAGALTVAEIAQLGKACIFIPYPYAVDNHQFYNAHTLSEQSGAIVLQEDTLNVEHLRNALLTLSESSNRQQMAQIAKSFAKPNATQDVANACLNAVVL